MSQIEEYDFSEAVDYHYGQFPPKNLNYEKIIKPLGEASAALGRYDAALKKQLSPDLLLAPLRRREAVISSRIEGTIATLDEVLRLEAEEEEGTTKFRNEVIEVFSYERALSYAQHLINSGLPISGRVIKSAHSKLLFLGRGSDKQPGEFKKEQNYVVDKNKKKVLFTPTSPEKFNEYFTTFEKYINEENIDPLLQTALAHIEFEALHPFKDGNGRVGRMLITLMLWSKGIISQPAFYISGCFESDKDSYIDHMREVSLNGNWTEWCVFFLENVVKQAEENLRTVERIDLLYEDMKDKIRELTASQWTINALDTIFKKPIFRNSSFSKDSGIPPQTARRITALLSDRQILTTLESGAGQRSTLYAFEPLLEIVRA